MKSSIQLKSVTLHSGDVVKLSPSVTAIVGPNNAGKSLFLRELTELIQADPGSGHIATHKIVSSVDVAYTGNPDDYTAALREIMPTRPPGTFSDGTWPYEAFILPNGQVMDVDVPRSIWGRAGSFGWPFGGYFATYLNAETRLSLAADTPVFDPLFQQPSNPLQKMQAEIKFEQSVNDAVKQAYAKGISVSRLPSSVIHLHAGETTVDPKTHPPIDAYVRELNSLPLMQVQGDGMRAFVGMIMSVVTGEFPLLLIDEPEAFLHPPQARRFGQFLARQKDLGTQIIVATHSQDIIAGLTSGDVHDDIVLARITRDGNRNFVSQLEPKLVKELFKDPLMRYFNMMDGLFSHGVVVCEADGDCTYFRAVIDEEGVEKMPLLGDAHFTHAAGKSRVPRALAAFRKISVPAVAVFDIDILRDDNEFNAVVKAIGEDPEHFKAWRNTINNEVMDARDTVKREGLLEKIDKVIKKNDASVVSLKDLKEIREFATAPSGWSKFKKAGKSMLSAGSLKAYKEITSRLEAKGVFIVEQGELERFHPEVSAKDKSDWLKQVIDQELYKSSSSLLMLKRIENFLESSQEITDIGS